MDTHAINTVPAPSLPPKQWLTPDEAAQVLGVGRTRLFEMMRSGRLKSSSWGRRTRRIHVADLIEFSDSLSSTGAAVGGAA